MNAERIGFVLHATYELNGKEVSGQQQVAMENGKIVWHGEAYDELFFLSRDEKATFTLQDVTIGKQYHWERNESQTFQGSLKLLVEEGQIAAVNILAIEDYLTSVISSEMKATASLEFLKAAAVISRSWLLSQMEQRGKATIPQSAHPASGKEEEFITWTDREAHHLYDVCADDHCQRYQGITRVINEKARQAVAATRGEILLSEGKVCDARFSKCCGGISENFSTCWEDHDEPYLAAIRDKANADGEMPDLREEREAEKWILGEPEAFCNTSDKAILSQVLNDYDLETQDFFRWTATFRQKELSDLIRRKSGEDFGEIVDLIPVERGSSGRIKRLKIIGTKKTQTVGKELYIRRLLSESHLYSSAFTVEKSDVQTGIPQTVTLHGAGWGHGVGLCQIGAAVMGAEGYRYDQILLHYYKNSELKKLY